MPLQPTYDNVLRLRALSARGIRTFEIPLLPRGWVNWTDGIVRPVAIDIETEKIDVERWLDRHDPWRKAGPQ